MGEPSNGREANPMVRVHSVFGSVLVCALSSSWAFFGCSAAPDVASAQDAGAGCQVADDRGEACPAFGVDAAIEIRCDRDAQAPPAPCTFVPGATSLATAVYCCP
jgi:hypothetical protein